MEESARPQLGLPDHPRGGPAPLAPPERPAPPGPPGATASTPPSRRRAVVLVVVALVSLAVVVALSRDSAAEPPVSVDPESVERVAQDVPYLIPDTDDPVLDLEVWAADDPAAGRRPRDRPLVVLYPPRDVLDRNLSMAETARSLAASGVVVVVPEPAAVDRRPGSTPTSGELLAGLTGDATCAASYAVSHAEDYGADPGTLVLVGSYEGALAAAAVAFREVAPSAGCVAPDAPVVAEHLVLHEGQWALGEPFDLTLRADPGAYDDLAVWSAVARAPQQSVTLLLDSTTVRPQRLDPALRPVPPEVAASMERHGVWEDGFLTSRESTVVLLDVLDAADHDARIVEYAGDWRQFGAATGEAVAQVVLDVTG